MSDSEVLFYCFLGAAVLVFGFIGLIAILSDEPHTGNSRNYHSNGYRSSRSNDNNWESSFGYEDHNNDGYDDRDDGIWNEQEF